MDNCHIKYTVLVCCGISFLVGLSLSIKRELRTIKDGSADLHEGIFDIPARKVSLKIGAGIMLMVVSLIGAVLCLLWLPDCKEEKVSGNTVSKHTPAVKADSVTISKSNKDNNRQQDEQSLVSIQLPDETNGYKALYINGKVVLALPESTKLNPRLMINRQQQGKVLLIITNTDDSCRVILPTKSDTNLIRLIPNCL